MPGPKTDIGEAREIFAIIKGEELIAIVAKNPDRPAVVDITNDLAKLLAKSANLKD